MPLIERDESMVLVIDAQEHFYGPHRTDVDRVRMDLVHDVAAWVVGAATGLGVPVVVTEEDVAKNGATTDRIVANLPAGAPILPKYAFSAPDNPDILSAIDDTGAPTCILIGMETDICVAQSALQLQARGKRVVAVADALYSPGAAHGNGLDRMIRNGVEVISAKELVYEWVRTVDGIRAFGRANPHLLAAPGFSM